MATALVLVVIGWSGGVDCGQGLTRGFGGLELKMFSWWPDHADSLQALEYRDYRPSPPGSNFHASLIQLFLFFSISLLTCLSVYWTGSHYITLLALSSLCSPE